MTDRLVFKKENISKDINDIFDYDIETFGDDADRDWSPEQMRSDVSDGWIFFSISYEDNLIAALALREKGKDLYSRHTAIRMGFRGQGHSHRIKEFVEEYAQKMGNKKIVDFCRSDNFRGIGLNESHGYNKEGASEDRDNYDLWVKVLK